MPSFLKTVFFLWYSSPLNGSFNGNPPPPDFWNRWYTFYFGNKNTQLCVAISKENVMYAKKYFVEF